MVLLLICVHGISFDADLPLEVDDEYWENDDPELAFKQPEGKPSRVTAYNLWLRLTDIIDFVLRTFVRPFRVLFRSAAN